MKQKKFQAAGVMKNIIYAGIAVASGFAMTGCAVVMGDLQTITADLTGCPPHAITVQDENMGYFNDTWTAKCEGRTFYCTRKVRGSTICDEAMTE